jgi:polyether ionophore transport system permease protein
LVTTPQARASLVALAQGFNWLVQPIAVDTPGGYATFKYGPVILLIALWAISAGGRILRGEEDRGSMDVLLSLPEGRTRMALQKLAAIWTALLGMAVLIGLLVYAGGRSDQAAFTFGDAFLFALNIALTSAVFAGVALFLSQFTSERGPATGMTGLLLVLSIVIDMVHRVIPSAGWVSRLSPVYYYNLTKPLVPGYGANGGALLLLLALAIILSGAGVWLFARRDVGGTVSLPAWLRLPQRAEREPVLPVNEWSLRSVYARSLGMIVGASFWWTLGIAGFAAWMVVVVKQSEAQLANIYQSSPALKAVIASLGGTNTVSSTAILSALFTFVPVALMAFAVVQANRWAADEENGRLELVLATPQPRLRVLGGRFAALTTSTVLIGVVTMAATVAAAVLAGVTLDRGNVAAASLSMIPLGLLVAALGYMFSGWLKTAFDTGLLTFLLALWFFISFLGPDLKWPDASLRLSPLYYYGTPLLHGLAVGGTLGILAVAVAALAVGSFRFARKDIAV